MSPTHPTAPAHFGGHYSGGQGISITRGDVVCDVWCVVFGFGAWPTEGERRPLTTARRPNCAQIPTTAAFGVPKTTVLALPPFPQQGAFGIQAYHSS